MDIQCVWLATVGEIIFQEQQSQNFIFVKIGDFDIMEDKLKGFAIPNDCALTFVIFRRTKVTSFVTSRLVMTLFLE